MVGGFPGEVLGYCEYIRLPSVCVCACAPFFSVSCNPQNARLTSLHRGHHLGLQWPRARGPAGYAGPTRSAVSAQQVVNALAANCATLEKNIAKLKARFPEKYTTENFENRDLAAERKVLE